MNKEELTALRNALKMTQSEFAFALGTGVTTISRWENGHTSPSRAYIKQLTLLQERNGLKTS